MKNKIIIVMAALFAVVTTFAQGFKVKASGEQTFSFKDERGRNQASFFSSTPLEDITGLSNDVKGIVTFNVSDISTMNGSVSISTASLKTGIESRDNHLQGKGWLDAESYPKISFTIKKVGDIKSLSNNKLEAKVLGDFFVHGVTKEVIADVTLIYLDESEETKSRAPGDLLSVKAKFNIKLSDYKVDNKILGLKVADDIEVTATMVGSNAK